MFPDAATVDAGDWRGGALPGSFVVRGRCAGGEKIVRKQDPGQPQVGIFTRPRREARPLPQAGDDATLVLDERMR
jgi:hypothetical protein